MTNTIPAHQAKADLSAADPYALLGTHAMRYESADVARIIESVKAARASLPALSRAFRANDADQFCEAFHAAELDLERALARADALLASLQVMR